MRILVFLLTMAGMSLSSAFLRSSRTSHSRLALKQLMSPVTQDVLSSCAALGGSVVWLQVWIQLAKSGKMDSRLSRKIIHCGSAPLFICLWPLYSSDGLATRVIASSIPLIQMIRCKNEYQILYFI